MSGGFALRAGSYRAWSLRTLLAYLAAVVVVALMSGCSLMQAPAPIIDLSTPQPASEPEVVEPEEEPASEPVVTQPPEVKAPRPKPKRRIVVPKKPPPPPPPPPEEKPPPPPPPLIGTRILQHEQLQGLLDSEIQRPDGKVIGRAVDMYADATAKPRLVVVNLAGFLGVGDRKVTFPWSAFRFNPAAKKAPVTFGAPTAPASGVKAKQADAPPRPGNVSDVPPTLAQLIDSIATQKNGGKMGRVVDVLIDMHGVPQALVIDLSDSLGGDERQIAADWADLKLVSRNKVMQLQLGFTDAQIKASPTYAPDQPIKIVSPVVPPAVDAPAAAGVAVPEPASAAPAAASAPPVSPASPATPAVAPAPASAHAPAVVSGAVLAPAPASAHAPVAAGTAPASRPTKQ